MSTTFTPAQLSILTYAQKHNDGAVRWFPSNIKGGARTKIIHQLQRHGFVTQQDDSVVLTPAAYQALGVASPTEKTRLKSVRRATKHDQVIALLKRTQGASVAQICELTGWQAHTVRGFFAGTLKKKHGLAIKSEKTPSQERIYRIKD